MIQESKKEHDEKSLLLKNSALKKGEKIRKARNTERRNVKKEEKEITENLNNRTTRKPRKTNYLKEENKVIGERKRNSNTEKNIIYLNLQN